MPTLQELTTRAQGVRDEVQTKRNTAQRIGSLFVDIITFFSGLLSGKQDKQDDALKTASKEIVPAINEVMDNISLLKGNVSNALVELENDLTQELNELRQSMENIISPEIPDTANSIRVVVTNEDIAARKKELDFANYNSFIIETESGNPLPYREFSLIATGEVDFNTMYYFTFVTGASRLSVSSEEGQSYISISSALGANYIIECTPVVDGLWLVRNLNAIQGSRDITVNTANHSKEVIIGFNRGNLTSSDSSVEIDTSGEQIDFKINPDFAHSNGGEVSFPNSMECIRISGELTDRPIGVEYSYSLTQNESGNWFITNAYMPAPVPIQLYGDLHAYRYAVDNNALYVITGVYNDANFIWLMKIANNNPAPLPVNLETSGIELFPYITCTNSDQIMENMNQVGRVFAMMFTPALSKKVSALQYIIAQAAPSLFEFALYRYTGGFSDGNIPVEYIAKTFQTTNDNIGLVETYFDNVVEISSNEVYYLVARTVLGDQMPRLRSANLNLLQDNVAPAALRGQDIADIAGFTNFSALERLGGNRIVPYVKMY